jgi:hypothetical protein
VLTWGTLAKTVPALSFTIPRLDTNCVSCEGVWNRNLNMKTLTVDQSIRTDPQLAADVSSATDIVEDELGKSAEHVEAEWRLTSDHSDRKLLILRLSDWTGAVEGEFAPDELRNPEHMRRRVVRLWGDLLQVRAHEQIESLAKNSPIDALAEIEDAVSDFIERKGREPQALKLPIRYAIELMKLGPSYWGEDFQAIRRRGTRAFDQIELFGMRVQVVPGVHGKLELE